MANNKQFHFLFVHIKMLQMSAILYNYNHLSITTKHQHFASKQFNTEITTRAACSIGGKNKGAWGPWPLLNLWPLHRIVIFAIENHFSLAKWPPYFQ